MIGWKLPAKAPYRRKTPQQMAVERADNRKKIKTYMSRADEYDVNNSFWSDYFLERRREYGESSIQVLFSLNCFSRLRPDIEL